MKILSALKIKRKNDMKLKDYETKHYKCDNCGSIEKHIDMYNDKYCYECININTGEIKADKLKK